jgi:hypothetical protein
MARERRHIDWSIQGREMSDAAPADGESFVWDESTQRYELVPSEGSSNGGLFVARATLTPSTPGAHSAAGVPLLLPSGDAYVSEVGDFVVFYVLDVISAFNGTTPRLYMNPSNPVLRVGYDGTGIFAETTLGAPGVSVDDILGGDIASINSNYMYAFRTAGLNMRVRVASGAGGAPVSGQDPGSTVGEVQAAIIVVR